MNPSVTRLLLPFFAPAAAACMAAAPNGTVRITNGSAGRTPAGIQCPRPTERPDGTLASVMPDAAFRNPKPGENTEAKRPGRKIDTAVGAVGTGGSFAILRRADTPAPGKNPVAVADARCAPGPEEALPAVTAATPQCWNRTENGATLTVSGNGTEARFSRKSGFLTELRFGGRRVITAPVRPNFFRSPADSDRSVNLRSSACLWEKAGRNAVCTAFGTAENNGTVTVTADFTLPAVSRKGETATVRQIWIFGSNGLLSMDFVVTVPEGLPAIPRIGVAFETPRALSTAEWFVRGPYENMPDSRGSAHTARCSMPVRCPNRPGSELGASHGIRDTEPGYRTDIRRLILRGDGPGPALAVYGRKTFGFSVRPRTADTPADGSRSHPRKQPRSENNTVSIDLPPFGNDGRSARDAGTLRQFRFVSGRTYCFGFTLSDR